MCYTCCLTCGSLIFSQATVLLTSVWKCVCMGQSRDHGRVSMVLALIILLMDHLNETVPLAMSSIQHFRSMFVSMHQWHFGGRASLQAGQIHGRGASPWFMS